MRMKWFLWLSVLLLVVHLADSGRIVRTWRRQGRMGPRLRLRPRPLSTWSFFRRPRVLRRNHQPFRYEQTDSHYSPQQRVASIQVPASSPFQDPKNTGWRPLNYGNPITRDPTFAYAPPASDQVKFAIPRRRPPLGGRNKIRGWRGHRPPHPFWRFLGYKQRRPPPRPAPSRPENLDEDEAEITPYVPNIVYFKHNEQIGSTTPSTTASLRPGIVSDVPIYPTEPSAPSEFKPMPAGEEEPGKDFILRVVDTPGGGNPPRNGATVLKPASSTPQTASTTQNSAPVPVESTTESFFDLIHPPEPINSFNINIDAAAEGSADFIKIVPAPAYSTTTSTTTTETVRPIFALRSSTQETTTQESTTFSTSAKSTSTKATTTIYKLPIMPAYKKRPSPVHPQKNVTKSSREQMSGEDMSSSIMITGIRSKVKEYKPLMLANYTQLLAFDKVSETTEESSTLATTSLRPKSSLSVVVTTNSSASPMQSFDPLNLIHSWLMKS